MNTIQRIGIASFITLFGVRGTSFSDDTNEQPTQRIESEIVFGMSTALTGPAAKLGQNMRQGVDAAFNEANSANGVHGNKLRLVVLDDGYEPSRTTPNMHALIDEHGVLAIIGNVGTPTAIAAIPIANESGVLLYGAYTGAGALRKSPPDKYVINFRASYAQETGAMVDGLIEHAGIKLNEIAFFTQRDAYGDAGYIGGINAMKEHGLGEDTVIAHGRYERNTVAIENGLADILMAEPPVKAVIMVGAYAPCATFIKASKEYGFEPIFLNVSFVGSAPLAAELGDEGDGVIITQVVPHFQSDLPIAHAYRDAIEAFESEGEQSFGSFEGYIAARVLIEALNQDESSPTRESVVTALEGLGTLNMGIGTDLELSPDKHQASEHVWPMVIQDGKVVAFSWEDLSPESNGALSEAASD